ncbi:MBL fold metallo-hydrolase [Candidatus Saccharibacteria bacterium]|jgi:L-ascorbate metabolism protein UlaG (beta-lactamase superfamily)|nr:MBL fold metallo-hydrolase [Candidatus Saccharibacteria bacterium]HPR09043.1 MBL fold metallo-hydrolase [Candidatus Saccharibacteria bacterium]
MKITKFGHSCILVELAGDNGKTVLFDPGVFSEVPVDSLTRLDDICITHEHADHCDVEVLLQLHRKFPEVRITTTTEVAAQLNAHGLTALDVAGGGIRFFVSPHEVVEPFGGPVPQQIGIHLAELFTHPGDSHSFDETMPVLALPVTAPWGTTVHALEVALRLKPRVVIPVHDWFWQENARQWSYDRLGEVFRQHGIVFMPLGMGQGCELDEASLLAPDPGRNLVIS